MEHHCFSHLPSIISTRPFYINPGQKPSPFRYKTPKAQLQVKTVSNSRVSGHQKSVYRLEQLRGYIENTISKQKLDWKNAMQKKKQFDLLELERKKKWIMQQRMKHKTVMKHMIEYFQAMKKYYWVRYPCDCGCAQQVVRPIKEPQIPIQKIPVKFRLNNIPFSSAFSLQKKKQDDSTFINSKSKSKQKSTNISIASKVVSEELKKTVTNYFTLLSNLEKNVKTHLSSTKDVHSLLQQLVAQKNKSSNNSNNPNNPKKINQIIKVLSLTKNHWQGVFKSVLKLKKAQKQMIKIARQSAYEVQYTQTQKIKKSMLDDMYNELIKNSQYMRHVQNQLKNIDDDEAISLKQVPTSKYYQFRPAITENPSYNYFGNSTSNFKPYLTMKNSEVSRISSTHTISEQQGNECIGHKAQIHNTIDDSVMEFMKHQHLIEFRKKNNRRTLLESLGIEHLVKRGGSTSNNESPTPNSSFYNQNPKGKQNSIKRPSRNQSIKLVDRKKSKISKQKKKKKVGQSLEQDQLISQVEQFPENIDEQQIVQNFTKPQSKFKSGNFLNGLVDKVVYHRESSLNNYQKLNMYNDERQNMFNKVRSIKVRKRLESVRNIKPSEYFLSKIDNHQNRSIIKSRLFQLFKLDFLNLFQKQATEFLENEDRMDEHIQRVEKIKQETHQGTTFDWVSNLNFEIETTDVDIMDLILNQKMQVPVKVKSSVENHEQYMNFNKQKTMTLYEKQCQEKRYKIFSSEKSFLNMRQQQKGEMLNSTLLQFI